ncbi:MAG: YkgJ family cysteine cluster protein [Desulfobacteraceae bacterium]|nr:YkgJ family cysteine cluster protein [Desulfobacteraceae bacterium]
MDIDFATFFQKYEALAAQADQAFERIKQACPEEVVCTPKCTDCCYALFDLTLIEALYLNHKFNETFTGQAREEMLEKANQADRRIYKLKREAFHKTRQGHEEQEVVEGIARERIRCPLLNDDDLCDLYGSRPIACRIYGAPLAIAGQGRTCGRTGFKPGQQYATINMDAIHDQLLKLSADFVKSIGSRHVKMGDVLVPVSMALLTDYNEEYLGIGPAPDASGESCQSGRS